MKNKRGITLASINTENYYSNNRGTSFHRRAGWRKKSISNNRPTLHFNKYNRKRKRLYVTFIDIQKTYDKTWQNIVMHKLWQNQIRGKIWTIVRKLNENLTAQCRTNHGLSRKIEIKKALDKGGVLSVTEFAISGVIYEQKHGSIIIDNLRL